MSTPSGAQLDGVLLLKGDNGYERARLDAVWNARKPARFPDAILLAASESDVVAAVGIARRAGWRIGVRSGGHSWIGTGVRDGGLLLDLSRLDSLSIDRDTRTAVAGPGLRGTDLNARLTAEGLVFPSGHCPSVAIGGFLLGGGYGWNSRRLGPACLSVEAIDVVLPDGRLVHADDTSHPDLMWAARGAGPGFFGIVTRYHLRVQPLYDRILRSSYLFPAQLRDELLTWSYDILPTLPAQLEMSVKVGYADGYDAQVASLTLAAFCAGGAGPELLEPARDFPELSRSLRRIEAVDSTLADLYALSDALTPQGSRYAVDGIWCDGPVRDILDAGRPVLESLPTRRSFLLWMLWGHYPTSPRACWSAQAPLYFSPNAVWEDPDDDLRCEQWAHGALEEMRHLSRGTQFSDANPADRPDTGLSTPNAARVEVLRHRFDPDGLLRSYLTPGESATALGRSRGRAR